ncbi:MAG: hypothetical protein KZQ64_09475 [gamma proteobacterium symbiont of Bathyaustriella thionipta]|nr:hypothetical protein [gamma proteobacterium symbiont of Bathyaustriella thionipta]MCU7949399.1 hypothetical protein [gamma proteobacterium symbiont of Bathyaustriella thionipta]MCU7953604.1 hypothetical protein [gamma proteobacterium symbiont of Bathyaustriella thionipta]MCU7956253.1 hypothetical protein [gamma proteobacterium symbiont of Bathyaustriella thionipta]MCU7965991.1 hypothetical protein [gamma proteobacterium symbiont of Bathyaustriella thionipta]
MAHYNLIFQGKIIDGASLDEVKKNISRLFKTDSSKTEALFSGKTIVIKKNLDTESTKKYLAVIKKTGAIVKAVKIDLSEPPSETAHSTKTAATSNNLSAGLASLVNSSTAAVNSLTSSSEQLASNDDRKMDEQSGLQLAPFGSNTPISSDKPEDIEIPDISYLSMSEAETGSLEEFAPILEAIELPDIDNLTMSDANTGSLEEFTIKVAPVELPDISTLDIAEQDNTPLSEHSAKPAPTGIPDTSDLSMSAAREGTLEGIEVKPEPVKVPDTSHLTIEKPEEQQAITGKAVFQID